MHVSHLEPLKNFCHCVCYVGYLSWIFLMKQKMTWPFLAALCIVNVKSISALAILQRKVIVFSFSISLSAFLRLLCQFQASWQMGEEGRGPQWSNFHPLLDEKFSKFIRTYGALRVLWLAESKAWKKVWGACSDNTGQHRDAAKIIFLQRIQTWLLDHIILTG